MALRTAPPRRYASYRDAAEYTSTSVETIRRWVASGALPRYRIGQGSLRVDLNEVDALAERR